MRSSPSARAPVRLKVGDRVCVYHISGCGQCDDCVRGYQISCSSPRRAAYGWQRDGGHADLILAEERDCVLLPDFVTFLDGACVACGFGTAYEGLLRANVSGRDSLAVVGLGPVGLAAGLLGGKLGAVPRVGIDPSPERRDLAVSLGAVDAAFAPDQVDAARAVVDGGAHVAIDCSGSEPGRVHRDRPGPRTRPGRPRRRGQRAARARGQPTLIHPSITILGSWVTSLEHMRELVARLPVWNLHPEVIVSDTFGLARPTRPTGWPTRAARARSRSCRSARPILGRVGNESPASRHPDARCESWPGCWPRWSRWASGTWWRR